MAKAFLAASGIDIDAEMSAIQFGNDPAATATSSSSPPPSTLRPPMGTRLRHILNARLPLRDPSTLYDLALSADSPAHLTDIQPSASRTLSAPSTHPTVLDARGAVCAPSLCHAHLHLDKPFLLSHPKFADLRPQDGTFAEAVDLTARAKRRFGPDDLRARGRQLLEESVGWGVTHARCHVELDAGVGTACLEVGAALRAEFAGRCDVQLAAFAQAPLFSGDGAAEARALLAAAAARADVAAVGSAPYVEEGEGRARENAAWVVGLALRERKMLDFHLDYHLEREHLPLAPVLVDMLRARDWNAASSAGTSPWDGGSFPGPKPITLGHCTRLSTLSPPELSALTSAIRHPTPLPVSLVALPTSDLYMHSSAPPPTSGRRTLDPSQLRRVHGLRAALAVNNVGNAFDPWGGADPLVAANLAGLVHGAGAEAAREELYGCVSGEARAAVGFVDVAGEEGKVGGEEGEEERTRHRGVELRVGSRADLVLFLPDPGAPEWRAPQSLAAVVCEPPARGLRVTVKGGVVVSR